MDWWIWIISGLGLLVLELFLPSGFYLFIIGLAAIIVGILTVCGILVGTSAQFTVASVIGILLILVVRKPIACALSALGKPTGSDITAQKVHVTENIAPGAVGKGELSGSPWTVRNDSGGMLSRGKSYQVKRTEGLTLIVTDL